MKQVQLASVRGGVQVRGGKYLNSEISQQWQWRSDVAALVYTDGNNIMAALGPEKRLCSCRHETALRSWYHAQPIRRRPNCAVEDIQNIQLFPLR